MGLLPSARLAIDADPARRLFADDAPYRAFVACRDGRPGDPPVTVAVPALGGRPVTLRPGTTDARTLIDACLEQFHLPPGPLEGEGVILDLGANIGLTALDLALRHPRARVIAVELDADNAALARAHLDPLGERVTVVHAGVWDRAGTVTYAGGDADALAVVPAPACGASGGAARTAPALTVDALVERLGLTRLDYVKVDIEGAEGRVISRTARWLQLVLAIKIEAHPSVTAAQIAGELAAAGLATAPDDHHWACVVGTR